MCMCILIIGYCYVHNVLCLLHDLSHDQLCAKDEAHEIPRKMAGQLVSVTQKCADVANIWQECLSNLTEIFHEIVDGDKLNEVLETHGRTCTTYSTRTTKCSSGGTCSNVSGSVAMTIMPEMAAREGIRQKRKPVD